MMPPGGVVRSLATEEIQKSTETKKESRELGRISVYFECCGRNSEIGKRLIVSGFYLLM